MTHDERVERHLRHSILVAIALVSAVLLIAPPALRAQLKKAATAPATKPDAGAKTPAAPPTSGPTLDAAVRQLTAESGNILPVVDDPKASFVYGRPHPQIAPLLNKPGMAIAAAQRLANDPLTGDAIRDTYIRWHLMPLILNSTAEETKAASGDLIKLIKSLPEYVKVVPKSKAQPTWEDPVAANKWHVLYYKTCALVGYPPFQHWVAPPESYKYMTDDQKKIADAAAAEMKNMPVPKQTGGDKDWQPWNGRLPYVCFYIWNYRFDVLYALARSGSEQALDALMAEYLAKIKPPAEKPEGPTKKGAPPPKAVAPAPTEAMDVVQAMDAALRDGSLSRYKTEKLQAASAQLKRGAAGNKNPFAYYGRPWVSFPNSTLHLTTSLDIGRIPTERSLTPDKPAVPNPTVKPPPITPDQLTFEMIENAMARGTQSIMQGPFTPLQQSQWWLSWTFYGYQPTQEMVVVWALLACGKSFQDSVIQQHLNWILSYDTDFPYDCGTRLQVLAQMPAKGYEAYLRRDIETLGYEITNQGNFTVVRAGHEEWGNNADGQYGVMGLWVGHRRDLSLKPELWQKIDQYWRKAQLTAAGNEAAWGLYANEHPVMKQVDIKQPPYCANGPMTAAACMSLSRTDHVLRSAQRLEVGQQLPRELQLGLNWLDHHFNPNDTTGETDNFYYMWAIQNLGQATGYRTFNKIDWYRDATTSLVNNQDLSGIWNGPKGAQVSTSFALLYLSRARGPLAVAKLRHGGEWHNRPADLYNFTEYCSEQFEVPTSWLIADPDQPVYELIESPLLYIASDKAVTLDSKQTKNLRDYVDAGGMIVCVPEGKNLNNPLKSFKTLASDMFPGVEPKKLDKKHAFFTLQQKVQGIMNLSTYDNAVRPMMVIAEKDLSRELQADDDRSRDAFKTLANIYLYAAGFESKRPRLMTNYLVDRATTRPTTGPTTPDSSHRSLAVARIKTSTGEYDPEPLAMQQLGVFMSQKHGIDLKITACLGTELKEQKLAFLTVSQNTTINDADAKAIRKWLEEGGTLWVDALAGDQSAIVQEDSVLSKIGVNPSMLKTMGSTHPIMSAKGLTNGYDNRRPAYRKYKREQSADMISIARVGNHEGVYVCHGDLEAGLAGLNHWEIAGYDPKSTRQIVANSVLLVMDGPYVPPGSTTLPTSKPTGLTTLPTTRAVSAK